MHQLSKVLIQWSEVQTSDAACMVMVNKMVSLLVGSNALHHLTLPRTEMKQRSALPPLIVHMEEDRRRSGNDMEQMRDGEKYGWEEIATLRRRGEKGPKGNADGGAALSSASAGEGNK